MKKLIYLIVLIVILGLIVSGCIPVIPPAEQSNTGNLTKGAILNVPTPYATIQAAIDAAASGDTILVAAGTYTEAVIINNSLTLQGAGSATTTVIGAHTITANDVIVDGFTLEGGITLDDSTNSISGGTISNNIIIASAQNGIRLGYDNGQSVDGVTIEGNIINSNSSKGIRFANPKNSGGTASYITIRNNEIKSNGSAGIETYGPGFNIITGNTISYNNGNGINLKFDDSDIVTGNIITNNTGPGITLRQVTNSTVEDNIVSGHQSDDTVPSCPSVFGGKGSGIHVFDVSENNSIRFNDISGNNYGIFIHSKNNLQPSGNFIAYNNIAGNDIYGILNALVDPPAPVDAIRNWWGSPTGPHRELPNGKWVGKGDKVGSNIDYKPWSPHPVEFCNNLSLTCTTIQDGTLLTSDGRVITTGYDEWGYDYQAHMFNGYYCDSYRDADWCQEWKNVRLMMCWNDAWLSNMDCDDDGLLDRHYGYESYIGSGAWLTNHQSGEYVNDDGETCKWNYFVKIVAAPSDAEAVDGIWYAADGTEIGPVIWGAFAIVQQVENDACAGTHGVQYLSPSGPGFGQYGPE